MDLLVVVGRPFLLEKGASFPLSVLSRLFKSSSVADRCSKEVRERLEKSMDHARECVGVSQILMINDG